MMQTDGHGQVIHIGPVEIIALNFPGPRVHPAVSSAIRDVVDRGYATVLDMIFVNRSASGSIQVTDADEDLERTCLGDLHVVAESLISEEDLLLLIDTLDPDSSVALIVYEETWARRLAETVRSAGGSVGLHVQVPRDTLQAALAAANS